MCARSFSDYSDVAITKLFAMLDVNSDGDIEREELREAFVRYSALRQAIGSGPNFK
jgi:Ca2+-binding EF-hand superfamily protein